jgi:hypothetical protein
MDGGSFLMMLLRLELALSLDWIKSRSLPEEVEGEVRSAVSPAMNWIAGEGDLRASAVLWVDAISVMFINILSSGL